MGPPFTLEKGISQVLPVTSNVTEIPVPAPWMRHTYRHIALTYPATCQKWAEKLARPKDACSISHSQSVWSRQFIHRLDWSPSLPPFPSSPNPCVIVIVCVYTQAQACVYMCRHTIFCTQGDQGVAGRVEAHSQFWLLWRFLS